MKPSTREVVIAVNQRRIADLEAIIRRAARWNRLAGWAAGVTCGVVAMVVL